MENKGGTIQGKRCHDLKTWPEPWAHVVSGRKPFEVRRDDRDYQRDDMLLLREWDPEKSEYTGWAAMVRVTWVTRGEPPSPLPEGVVVLGLELLGRAFQFIAPQEDPAPSYDVARLCKECGLATRYMNSDYCPDCLQKAVISGGGERSG